VTITIKPAQADRIHDAIAAGLIDSPEDLIDVALAALPHKDTVESSRRAAVERMLAFGEKHKLGFGQPITRQTLHEGHRV
jgi:hypothetical protein